MYLQTAHDSLFFKEQTRHKAIFYQRVKQPQDQTFIIDWAQSCTL